MFSRIAEDHGRLDVLHVNAGFYEFGRLGEITGEHLDRSFDTNVRGLVFTVQGALPLMRSGGSVVLAGSIEAAKELRRSASTPPARPRCARWRAAWRWS